MLVALFALASSACAGNAVPKELLGSWIFRESSGMDLPAECHKIRLEFTPDGNLIGFSGEQRFTTKVSIARRDGMFIVHTDKIIEHNDKPNCQGRSAEYVASHFVDDMYFEYFDRDGAVLRIYIWTKESGRLSEFVRARPKNPELGRQGR